MRLLIIILIFIAAKANAQVELFHAHNYTNVVNADTLFIDSFTTPTAAYSLRKLRSAYSGNCIQVRRSSDNTTQDIGFVNNYLDTASLKSFVGANSGFVSIWYDQSGSKNATTAANTNQPRIVNAGAIDYQNGEPTLVFDGSDDYFALTSQPLTGATALTFIAVADFSTASAFEMIFTQSNAAGIDGVLEIRRNNTNNSLQYINGASNTGSAVINSSEKIYNIYGGGTNLPAYFNETADITGSRNTTAIGNYTSRIGARSDGFYFGGIMKELIIFDADKSSTRLSMVRHINRFYSIY